MKKERLKSGIPEVEDIMGTGLDLAFYAPIYQ